MFNKKSLLLITALCIHAPYTLLMAAASASQTEHPSLEHAADPKCKNEAEQLAWLRLEQQCILLFPIKSKQPITRVKTSMELREKCVDSAPDIAPNQTES